AALAQDYTFTAAGSMAGSLVVTPKALSAAVVTPSASVVYGATRPALFALDGVVGTDQISLTSGTGALGKLRQGYGPSDTRADVGTYSYVLTGLSGAAAGNYTLSNPGLSASLTVTPAPLTWSVASANVIYGGLYAKKTTFGTQILDGATVGAATL